jgi:hypothetical protein
LEESEQYFFRTNEADSLLDEIQISGEPWELSNIIHDIATRYGFKYGSIFLLRPGRSRILWEHRVCTSLPEHWLRRYKDKEYQFIDPVILRSFSQNTPNFAFPEANDSPVVSDFWRDAVRHGIGSTVYFGKHELDSGAAVGFSFTSENSSVACRKRINLDESDIFQLTGAMAEVFEEVSALGNQKVNSLSKEELNFLKSILSGRPVNSPINYSGFKVCPKGVQASILRKLGVRNIFQAISTATAQGWFNDIPYLEDEVHTIFENVPYSAPEVKIKI